MLQIKDLTYRIAGRTLLDGASLHVPVGHRFGLIGRNGTGKSTLFKLITGELHADGGSIELRKGARLGVLPQEAPGGPESLLETVLAADIERAALMQEAETATDGMRIAEIHTRLADIDAHTAEARAAKILSGLGFDHDAQQRPCSSFSGGWRTRVALAGTLFAEPDLLLLDEPSNYLDLEATLWLESFLRNYQRTLIIISHDKDLLNNVVTEIAHLDQMKLVKYTGNYAFFEKTRREQMELLAGMARKQEAHRKHLQSFVDRFRAKASKARQAQSRVKMLEKMQPVVGIVEEHTASLRFQAPEPLSSPIITMEGCTVGYTPGKPVLRHLDLRIDMDDRIALLGSNGNGKSTFAKLIAGRLKPETGKMQKSGKLKIGFFAQHQLDEMHPEETAYQHLAAKVENGQESKIRARLGQFGFSREKTDTPVSQLSGGEKARLNFCLIAEEKPHLLILDEPTNHLDVDSREALIEGLNAYEGAVLLISHDPHLVSLVADRLWLVKDGGVHAFEGDIEDYKREVLDGARGGNNNRKNESESAPAQPKLSGKEARKARAAARAALAPKQQELKRLERQMQDLAARQAALETDLADPATYDKGPAHQAKLTDQIGRIKADLARTEEKWLALSEELEAQGAA
ncbi:MAG: glycosyl transferase family 1 [Sneathiella sp.]|jgi:ATP-binding cassette subfamily F protein 3|uniref:ABC-F family ATP-binding cassette domain-containing protein n=1 Tax=Sneathiella sp. TaxID=1964365 RepID=UPI000C59859A|nr:ABC-F family ATP-binding cassette domain-containing protein [Sneathiella sp.]MAL79930.1 glycosyl transferase family 1 [Sneathiella sp.]